MDSIGTPCSHNPSLPAVTPHGTLPDDIDIEGEIGLDKTPAQHAGNTGMAFSSAASITEDGSRLLMAANVLRATRVIPLINIGVAAIETVNAARKIKEKDYVVATSHGGNAAGCAGAVFDTSALIYRHAGLPGKAALFLTAGVALGLIGGALGIGAGIVEIRRGHELRKNGGSSRTLMMGILDITSGSASATGALLTVSGMGAIGIPLLIGASLCDAAGIAIDYLAGRKARREAAATLSAPP